MTVPVIFRFNVPTRDGAKEARLRASLDSRQPEGGPSGHPTFVGLGLETSDRQRFARIQIFRKRQSLGANLSKSFVHYKQPWGKLEIKVPPLVEQNSCSSERFAECKLLYV